VADPRNGIYVRAVILCGAVEKAGGGQDTIRSVITQVPVANDCPTFRADLSAYLAFERNGDRGHHRLELKFVDPAGRDVSSSGELDLFVPGDEDTIVATMPAILETRTVRSGRYRLTVWLDGEIAGFAPLDVELVEPGSFNWQKPH
jgi:hypothetical protein